MRWFIMLKINLLILMLFVSPFSFAQSIPEGVPMGDVQCGCPGGMKYQGVKSMKTVEVYAQPLQRSLDQFVHNLWDKSPLIAANQESEKKEK